MEQAGEGAPRGRVRARVRVRVTVRARVKFRVRVSVRAWSSRVSALPQVRAPLVSTRHPSLLERGIYSRHAAPLRLTGMSGVRVPSPLALPLSPNPRAAPPPAPHTAGPCMEGASGEAAINEALAQLLIVLETLDNHIGPAVAADGAHFNRHWGFLSRAGVNDKSQLMRQIEKYAGE